jgi:MinD-like ATPase involved in chromosome partitioning or flagellar assembly/ActR/RegA family two-component response regulator
VGVIANLLGHPMALLLLEDDLELQHEFERTVDQVPDDLTLVSYTSQESEVVRLAVQNMVDCVFVDESLPRRPWTSVVKELRERCPEARVVLHTERPSKALLDEALDNGARFVIRKGLAPDDLVAALKDVLDDERRRRLRLEQFGEAEESDGRGRAVGVGGNAGPVHGHIIALGSGIAGGTGKTTAIVNMLVWLANNPYRRFTVAGLDLEKDVGSVSSFFPSTPPSPSILEFTDYAGQPQVPPEILRGKLAKDSEAARKFRLNLVFGACDLEREDEVTEDLVRTVLVSLRLTHQFVLVDLPADLTDAAVATIEQSNRVLWLIRDYQPDLTRTRRAFEKLRALGVDTTRIQVVLSRIDPHGRLQFTPRQVHETLGAVLMPYAIPEEPQLKAMARAFKFPAKDQPEGAYMQALRKILEEIQPGTGFPAHGNGHVPVPGAARRRGFWIFGRRAKAGVV